MTTLHELAEQIATSLSTEAWTCLPPIEEQVNFAVIERCDGLQLHLMRCDSRGWVDVSGNRISIRPEPLSAPDEHDGVMRYDYDRPTITVAATRTAASIAGDIRTRLLPDAESWYNTALLWQQRAIATHVQLCDLRSKLLAFPGAHPNSFSRRLYGEGWTCEPRSGRSLLIFELPSDLIVNVLTAYHHLIEEPMNSHQSTDHLPTDQQQSMFPAGDDLPLFSGAPMRTAARRFHPTPAPDQPAMLDLRPTFGGVEPTYTPEPEAQP